LIQSGRLIVVYRADPHERYSWLPPLCPGDVTVVLDELAGVDLAERQPVAFDRLTSWEERSAVEHHVNELLAAIAARPAIAAIGHADLRLIDFAEYRLRSEVVRLLRGWTLARAGVGVGELICDPALPPAFEIGARAGLGLDPRMTAYVLPPALPGSRSSRAVARQLTRIVAATSRPEHVRVAAVAAGKLALALGSLPAADLRAAGVGLMGFPGLDHGNGLLLALRRRLPLLPTYGPAHPGVGESVSLPDRLDLEGEAALDRALTLLVGNVLAAAAPELAVAVGALAGLDRAPSLRAVLLPSAAYGASRLLIEWAHQRNLPVGAMQHGIYAFREGDGGDRRADIVFGWGAGTAEQIAGWPESRPAVRPVGVPGLIAPAGRSRRVAPDALVRRGLIATSNTVDTPLAPVAFCEAFIETLVPGIERLVGTGVEVELRPHPSEEPERYRRLLRARGLDVRVTSESPFVEAIAGADILVSSASSVAFEAAALGVPVLLWLGAAPRWLRAEHLLPPWSESLPGTFQTTEDFSLLVGDLLERPAEGWRVAHELARRLARYAQPFDAARFAAALGELG
jgi:hypothetical protein